MKYKVGDEVLLKANVRVVEERNGKCNVKVQFEDNDTLWFCERVLIPVSRNYDQGLNDAWELAKRISGILDKENHELIPARELTKIYGSNDLLDIFAFTPQEALAKLKAYEEAQIEVVVGDVVEMPNGIKCVVTVVREDVAGNDIADGFTYVGYAFYDFPLCDLKKTGKHIDISSLLEQIGE